jgi:hypothetical protein
LSLLNSEITLNLLHIFKHTRSEIGDLPVAGPTKLRALQSKGKRDKNEDDKDDKKENNKSDDGKLVLSSKDL